ncbi:MAG: 3-dehydroquinate synthase [Clostridia bacterium]|nr:3-dehydroquinate synthase [Clostridia bacterium]
MKTINVNTSSKNYNIYIGKNLLEKAGEFIEGYGKIAVVCDTNVEKLYLDTVLKALPNAKPIVIPAGEEYKTLDTVTKIYSSLAEMKFTRKDLLVALGGGVTGDITGFCAATYLRGCAYIQMPTTLLSQVDSSIGGKTGVDLPFGKNLVGAFKQPEMVIADTETLKTLPPEQVASGMAEIIKSALIADEKLVEKLENSDDFEADKEDFIIGAINVKKHVVEIDEFEKYERMWLNYGHTFGHSIEKYMGFTGITHGQAVAVGMYMITTEPELKNKVKALLVKYNLGYETDIPAAEIVKGSLNDKKAVADGVNVVLLEKAGKAYIKKYTCEELNEIYG